MRKLVVPVLVILAVLLLGPAAASAAAPTLKSLAKSLAVLQKTEKSQAKSIQSLRGAIKSLQGKGTSQTSTIARL
jgi:hypothetical protein